MNFMDFAGNSNLELDLKIIFRIIWGYFMATKNPEIHPNFDFSLKNANLNFNIENSKFTEFTLNIALKVSQSKLFKS